MRELRGLDDFFFFTSSSSSTGNPNRHIFPSLLLGSQRRARDGGTFLLNCIILKLISLAYCQREAVKPEKKGKSTAAVRMTKISEKNNHHQKLRRDVKITGKD